ncbi:methyl-accepting chemotaxis protein [Pandoraea cepalis]|uniref:Chemotaxis protein n=2 Tax=Pandoraea TaxID=93217 RepID=A0A5E4TTN3_9BURK|nr:methyl-accepting chemotaxis protein [Pandoraea cepalis]VVD89964.1 chemotaxis protein [Pandoraea cepalis]
MKLSFSQKLWLPLILSLACFACLSISDAISSRGIRLEERQSGLVHAMELAKSVIQSYADQAATGTLTIDEAKRSAIGVIRKMRYAGGKGYFTILNPDGVLLMSATKPEDEGRNVSGFRDRNGEPFNQNVLNQIHRDGSGFTRYAFGKPGATGIFPKISYNDAYRPWQWILMTGVYVDDINAAFYASLVRSLGVFAVIGTLLSIAVVGVNRGIWRSLGGEPKYAAEIATRIAENDLAFVVQDERAGSGSLLHSMKRMRDHLAETIRVINVSAESVSVAAHEIAGGNIDLSIRTEAQAVSLNQTVANMAELAGTIRHNADNACRADMFAANVAGLADAGDQAVAAMLQTIGRISESSAKISEITGMIEAIAFQTNILSLNAAVESARAGAHGRGFAVVASEVRALAQRAACASRDIKALIETSSTLVADGSRQAHDVGTTMGRVRQAINELSNIVGEIAAASSDQGKRIELANQAFMQMDESTQQNAALVEEAAAAAQSLEEQASNLREAVSVFRLSDPQDSRRSPPDRAMTLALGAL